MKQHKESNAYDRMPKKAPFLSKSATQGTENGRKQGYTEIDTRNTSGNVENRKFHVKQTLPPGENNSSNERNNRQNGSKHNLSTQMIKNKYEMTCPTDLLPDKPSKHR